VNVPTSARKKHLIGTGGPWGTGLLLLGVAATVQGIGYTTAKPGHLPEPIAVLSRYVPPAVWGGLWIAAGLWSVWKALTPPQQHWEALPVVGVLLLWAAAYLFYWLILGMAYGHWTRTWQGAVGWAMLAGLVMSWSRCVNPPQLRRR
jgi:hypothetical protein